MAKKISQAALDRIASEGSSRVIVKSKAIPKTPKVVAEKAEVMPVVKNDIPQELIADILKTNKGILEALGRKQEAPKQEPQLVPEKVQVSNVMRDKDDMTESADITVIYSDSQKTIHVSSVIRDKHDRISGADLSVTKG